MTTVSLLAVSNSGVSLLIVSPLAVSIFGRAVSLLEVVIVDVLIAAAFVTGVVSFFIVVPVGHKNIVRVYKFTFTYIDTYILIH
jgi:hypothetical protein